MRIPTRSTPVRRLALAGLVGVTVVALAGCAAPGAGGGSDAAEQEDIAEQVTADQVADLGDITLTMWADQAEEPLMDLLVPAYEEAYPNVTVDITYKSFDDLIATVVNAANSANAPDLFQGNIGYAVDGALVKAGLVRPLDDVADVYGWNEGTGASTLAPSKWNDDATTFGDGTLYGMSPISEVQGIYYNTSKLEALGLDAPASIDDLEAALPVAAASGETPIMLGNADQYAGTHIFSDIAATTQDPADIRAWIGGDPDQSFVTDGNVEAAETMAEWADAGYFGDGYDGLGNEDAIARFADGDGVFFVGGSWNGASLNAAEFGFGALASGGVGATASPWHISSSSENAIASIAFLEMLHSPETGQWILDTGRLPVITDGVTAGDELQQQTLDALTATIDAGTQVGYYDWTTTDMLTVMGGGLQEVMAGRSSADDFVETVQAAWADGHGSE
ncbi:ABC transporter substrate-binding protein [Labedella endophytica]|uniref:Extracellular solute-binding protein n=1 Tax=Labedella endophytica TaxID=1523160 RepID=A0A433JR79_9MICO|nr:extracellular solute-binding protein [Labedella endophytica]RUQ99111.1 extracellular solute-binding protein [Labedella endophytica]